MINLGVLALIIAADEDFASVTGAAGVDHGVAGEGDLIGLDDDLAAVVDCGLRIWECGIF